MAYCNRCQRWFTHDRAYEQHIEDSSSHWICGICDIDFASPQSLGQHYADSPKHHHCRVCDRHFVHVRAKVQHMEAKHWYCQAHKRVFESEDSLNLHFEQRGCHW
ncbi:hypothetical protein BC826DRAFT_951180 [Russula brevipes]|nr:hypothetical protein BC826DRAFT_951180 [Russula brevipes]